MIGCVTGCEDCVIESGEVSEDCRSDDLNQSFGFLGGGHHGDGVRGLRTQDQ